MKRLMYSTAALALLLGSSLAFAQSGTTTQPQTGTGTTTECPAPGSVPEAQLPAGCRAGENTTQAPAVGQDSTTTGQTTAPATGNDTATAPQPGTEQTDQSAGAQPAAPLPQGAEYLASQFMGRTVYTPANENVGEINDLIMNKELNTIVAVIGVGGFLGIGEKDVAIPIDQITVTKDENNTMRLNIAQTKEQLEAAPPFDRTALLK